MSCSLATGDGIASQGALFLEIGAARRRGFLFNRHYLSHCRAHAHHHGLRPRLRPAHLPTDTAKPKNVITWWDPGNPPPDHLMNTHAVTAGTHLHETTDATRETLALVEMLPAVGTQLPVLYSTDPVGASTAGLVRGPYRLDVNKCAEAASELKEGDPLLVLWRHLHSAQLWTSTAIFLAFAGTESALAQTLVYWLVAEEGYAIPSFMPGCCGSVVCTVDGWLVGMHSTGLVGEIPSIHDGRVEALFGGQYVEGHTGVMLVGAHRRKVDPRKYVEEADLSSYERFKTANRKRNIPANQYDAGISIYEMRDSLLDWHF
jgi:hypothetical protein